jgi:hypothetical protein
MTDKEGSQDLPTIVASVMVTIPPLVFRTGWAYLRMRKHAQKASKKLELEFVSNGIPPEYAERLAEQYATDLSIKTMIRQMDLPFRGAWRQQSLEK